MISKVARGLFIDQPALDRGTKCVCVGCAVFTTFPHGLFLNALLLSIKCWVILIAFELTHTRTANLIRIN